MRDGEGWQLRDCERLWVVMLKSLECGCLSIIGLQRDDGDGDDDDDDNGD